MVLLNARIERGGIGKPFISGNCFSGTKWTVCADFCTRCLAHVINLATLALIGGYSLTKHFDPTNPTDHEPDVNAFERDPVGLIQAITVKVCYSCSIWFNCTHTIICRFGHLQNTRISSSLCKASRLPNRRHCSLIWKFAGALHLQCSGERMILSRWVLDFYYQYLCLMITYLLSLWMTLCTSLGATNPIIWNEPKLTPWSLAMTSGHK